jgi:hypothetical protein
MEESLHSTVALKSRFPTYAHPKYRRRAAIVEAKIPPHKAPILHFISSFSGLKLIAVTGHPTRTANATPTKANLTP